MNRLAAYLLLLVFLGLGTGGLEYVHNLEHAAEDAREDAIAAATGKPPAPDHHHDETNCPVHAQLHMPLLTGGWAPLLLALGLLIRSLCISAESLIPRPIPTDVDCRGPPAPLSR